MPFNKNPFSCLVRIEMTKLETLHWAVRQFFLSPWGCAVVCMLDYIGYMPPYFQMELYTVHDATWCQPRISVETCILCDIFGGEQNAEPHGHMAGRDWLMGLCLCIWKEPDRAVDEPRWPALHSEARRVLGRVLGQLWCGSRMDAAVVVWEPEC